MARKKEKIRVNLELPKDDKTQSNFIAILMVGMLIGITCLGFWLTNSGLVLPQANGNPAFLNMACPDSFDAMDPAGPTYFDNQTCFLTEESPNEDKAPAGALVVTPYFLKTSECNHNLAISTPHR